MTRIGSRPPGPPIVEPKITEKPSVEAPKKTTPSTALTTPDLPAATDAPATGQAALLATKPGDKAAAPTIEALQDTNTAEGRYAAIMHINRHSGLTQRDLKTGDNDRLRSSSTALKQLCEAYLPALDQALEDPKLDPPTREALVELRAQIRGVRAVAGDLVQQADFTRACEKHLDSE